MTTARKRMASVGATVEILPVSPMASATSGGREISKRLPDLLSDFPPLIRINAPASGE